MSDSKSNGKGPARRLILPAPPTPEDEDDDLPTDEPVVMAPGMVTP